MAASKRLRSSTLTHEKTSATSTSIFIETILTPTSSVSPTTENLLNISKRKESTQLNEHDGFHHRKSQLVQSQIEILPKSTTKHKPITNTNVDESQSNDEDDWVCPVAVALRRAGYNVPLRPSKSWLERDRKKQALLREQRTSFKEM